MKKCKYYGCDRKYLEWIPFFKKKPKPNQMVFMWRKTDNIFETSWWIQNYDPIDDIDVADYWMPLFDGPDGMKLE